MIEEENSPEPQEIEITDLTSALMSALGMKTSEQAQKIQSVTIFLSKLYRKYSQQTGKKFNEVKLSRLNGLFYKICKEPPTQKSDLEVIYHMILAFFNNEGASPIDDNSFAANTSVWVARFIEDLTAVKLPIMCTEILETILKLQKPLLMSADDYQKTLSQSPYFKDKQITKMDETNGNKKSTYKGFMSEYTIFDQIKNNLNVKKLFENLYGSHPTKTEVMRLFVQYCRETDVDGVRDIFVDVFVKDRVQDRGMLGVILECLDSEFFTAEEFGDIVKLLLATNDRRLFYSLSLKGLKNQTRYLEILAEQSKPNLIDQLADIFTSEQQVNNYYLLYLIQKSPQKLSQRYLTLPQGKAPTNRQAIICALAISQNIETAHSRILKHFFDHEAGLNNKQKLDYLKIAHFSYLNVPKSHLFTSVIKGIPFVLLNKEADFQFLPREGYEKIQLDKNQREELNDFLSRHFGNSDDVYWIKLDLYTICGKQMAYMSEFKKVQKIFESSIETVVQELPTIPDSLLEVVLMGVNNKLADQFVVNQGSVGPILQWALDMHKKEYKKFRAAAETYLKRTNNLALLELCLDLFDFNSDQKTQMEFDEEFKIITSAENSRKLNGLHFSQYFMGPQTGEENQHTSTLIKNKNLVIQLHKLIKNLSNDSKTQNRKELKTLVGEESTPLKALKIIKSLSLTPYEKAKNPEKLQALTDTLLSYVKPQYEHFKQLAQKASGTSIPYIPIFESLQFLLTVNYEKSINFLVQLLKSKPGKIEQKHEKARKTTKKKVQQQSPQKNLESILQNLEYCFKGDPNSLTTYSSIISIIEEMESAPNHENLAEEVTKWVGRIKMFHKDSYKEWKDKVFNYIKLWEAISGLVGDTIAVKEIQRHFLIMIDLLNTLYEKYRQEKDLLVVEKRLLTGLYTLYLMAQNSKDEPMQQQIQPYIPRQKLNEVLINYQLGQLAAAHIYHCFDCNKKTCHECASIIHKHHDKNYIGQGNESECHRFGSKVRDADKNKMTKEKYIQKLIREGGGLESFQREREKFLIISQAAERLPPDQFARFKEEKLSMFRRNERLSTLLAQSESQEADLDQERKKENEDDPDKLEIKSCSQKEFGIKMPTLVSESSRPRPIFESDQSPSKKKAWKLNLTPLFNLLVRELKSNSFFYSQQLEAEKSPASQFEAEISNEKYTIVKMDYFKNNVPRMGATYLANQEQHPNAFATTKRNLITISQKYLAILSGGFASQVHYLDTNTIRNRFLKKQSQKRYKENDTLQTYQINQNKINEPSILQIVLSPFAPNLIAQISAHKILFQQISRDVRNRLICLEQCNGVQIVKFQWMRAGGLKSFYVYLAGEIFVGKIGKRDSELKQKISLGDKKIRDFTNCALNSKMVMLTVLDTEGKLYRCKLDPYNTKKPPSLPDYKLNLSLPQPTTSITSHSNWLFCTTQSGKLTLLCLNQQNSLTSLPIHFPLIDQLRTHKISQINMKFKEVNRIAKLRYITKYQNQIFVACLLVKDGPGEIRKSGYFVIVALNLQSKRAKLVMYNDQGTTDSYDFVVISDKEFLFTCLQDDGELWACKLTAQPKSTASKTSQPSLALTLNSIDLTFYSQQISKLHLFEQLQFFHKDRKKSLFKQNQKITDHFKANITPDFISFEVVEKYLRNQFVTGIEFVYTHNPEVDGSVSRLAFSFLGQVYRFQVGKAREIQIPLTIRETLGLFLGVEEFKFRFTEGKPTTNIKDITIFGVRFVEKTVYSQALTSLCEMLYIYRGPKQQTTDKRLEKYFYNENKTDLKMIEPKPLEEYFGRKKFSLEEQNMLLKLELLRQSVEKYKNDSSLVYECFESIRNFILPHCQDRNELVVSVYKLCLALTESSKDTNALKLGHILNYETQLDIYNAFRIYKIFRTEATVDSYQDLLAILCKILNSRTLNGIIIMSVYPDMLRVISKFFKKLLTDYKLFFKTNDYGLEKDEKQKLNRICNNMMRILIESYQLQKNRDRDNSKVNCQEEVLEILESIFCLNKKEVHREIKLNPFQYFQSTFEQGTYVQRSPAINYLRIEKIDLEEPRKPIDQSLMASSQEKKIKLEGNVQPPPVEQLQSMEGEEEGENEPGYEESCEEHKEREEENREMLEVEEYPYEMPAQGGLNAVQKLIEEEEELSDSDRDMPGDETLKNSEMNTKKIYEALYAQCQAMTPEELSFQYHPICENILIQLFGPPMIGGQHKYLYSYNLVFYVGLVYNLVQIVDKKITAIFEDQRDIDFGHPYIRGCVSPIFDAIDSKIQTPSHSVLYLPLNSLIAANPKDKTHPHSAFIRCLMTYYERKFPDSVLANALTCSKWFPEEYKQPTSLSSVLRFEYFDTVNPLYQIKYVGNLYLHLLQFNPLRTRDCEADIKDTVLKAVVRYNLKIYKNIMLIKDWQNQLQKTKINVAFQKLKSKPEQSLRTIIKSINKDIKSFINETNSNETRITALEELLGENSVLDELVLEVLNYYYSYEGNKA